MSKKIVVDQLTYRILWVDSIATTMYFIWKALM